MGQSQLTLGLYTHNWYTIMANYDEQWHIANIVWRQGCLRVQLFLPPSSPSTFYLRCHSLVLVDHIKYNSDLLKAYNQLIFHLYEPYMINNISSKQHTHRSMSCTRTNKVTNGLCGNLMRRFD